MRAKNHEASPCEHTFQILLDHLLSMEARGVVRTLTGSRARGICKVTVGLSKPSSGQS